MSGCGIVDTVERARRGVHVIGRVRIEYDEVCKEAMLCYANVHAGRRRSVALLWNRSVQRYQVLLSLLGSHPSDPIPTCPPSDLHHLPTYLPTYSLTPTRSNTLPPVHPSSIHPSIHPFILLTSSTIHNITSAYPFLPPESSGRGYISATTPPAYPRAYVLRSAKAAHIHSSFCVWAEAGTTSSP